MASIYSDNENSDAVAAGARPISFDEAASPLTINRAEDNMQDILPTPPTSAEDNWGHPPNFPGREGKHDILLSSTQDSQLSNSSGMLSSQDSEGWSDEPIRVASPRSPRSGDLDDEIIRPAPDIYVADKNKWRLNKIDETSDDERYMSQGSDSIDEYEGSPASTQENLSNEMSSLTAGIERRGYLGMGVDDTTPGQASPTGSRKRKASNGLPLAIVEKAARNLLESGRPPTFLVGTENTEIEFPHQLAISEVSVYDEFSQIYEFGNINHPDDEQVMSPIGNSSRQELLQNVKQPSLVAGDLAGCTLGGNQEEQEHTASGINLIHNFQTTSIPAVVSNNEVVHFARAASVPLYTPATQPNIRTVKRRATIEVVNLAKNHLALSNLKLSSNPIMVETGGYGPPLYEAASVATSVMYWPEDNNGESEGESHGTAETDFTPKPSAGLKELPKYLPNGGTILSVHQPATSLAWLEENYDLPIVKSIRYSEVFSGPFAMMLFPEEPSLAIFGPRAVDPKFAELAQKLANKSGFPVIARPSADDPMFRLKSLIPVNGTGKNQLFEKFFAATPDPVVVMTVQTTTDGVEGNHGNVDQDTVNDHTIGFQRGNGNHSETNSSSNGGRDGMGGEGSEQGAASRDPIRGFSGGNGGPQSDGESNDPSGPYENGHSNASSEYPDTLVSQEDTGNNIEGEKKLDGDGGSDPDDDGNDPGAEADKWEDWLSPWHMTQVNINVQASSDYSVHLKIGCQTQFRTYADGNMPIDPNREWAQQDFTRSQAQVHTKFRIQFPSPQILLDRSFAVLGLQAHRPYSISKNDNLDCGFSAPTQTYKHIKSTNVQNTFTASLGLSGVHPAPTAAVTYAHGQSATNTIEAADTKPMPLCDIKADPGEGYLERDGTSYESYNYSYKPRCDLLSDESVPPPQVSCINRNQVFLWVQDPSLRSKLQGVVLIISINMNDIRRRSAILRAEDLKIDLETGRTIESNTGLGRDDKESAFSLSVIPVSQKKYKPETERNKRPSTMQRVRRQAKQALRRIKPAPPQVTLAAHEFVSRGWDATNYQWRNTIYPELDRHFRPLPPPTDPSLVAYKISPFTLK
ncbi:hypothetical protein B0H10DRAFT_1948678 [Mycena sp. CBHHK59/15]|nr:hypothetical protein B0H10DRAFT_1948678 [Mycena sp. CBHHK59/15]